MDVLIQGAGIAGCALALLLRRQRHNVTVVERAYSLRQGGQAVDVRGAALKVIERMGLMAAVCASRTRFRGMSVCDDQGEEIERTTERTLTGGRFDSGDVELFRDDLSRILFDATGEGTTYMFGDQVASLEQHNRRVDVRYEGGGRGSFDLVIGADGLHSGVRRRAFGPDDRYLRPLGIYAGIYSAPNRIGLHDWQLVFRTPERGVIIFPTRSNEELRVALYFAGEETDQQSDDAAQKNTLRRGLGAVGGPFATMLAELDRADDLWAAAMAQVPMEGWSIGRIVLAGDAAHCPSPLTGQGTSLALVGAHLLAEEVGRSDGDVEAIGLRYERRMRPFVNANLAIDIATGEGIDAAKNAIDIDQAAAPS
jgi:2-polyprenyl-6-methoxyphenol hydroxylase-like FAD-dependent oxidoreductase